MPGSTLASPTADGAAAAAPRPRSSLWAETWRRFKRHRLAYWGLWVLVTLVLLVVVGPFVYKVGINDIDFKARLASPSGSSLCSPGAGLR